MSEDNKINKILNAGASNLYDILYLSKKIKLNIKYIGSIYDLKKYNIKLVPGNYMFLLHPKEQKHNLNGHWVCLKVEKRKAFYFDSYGEPPSDFLQSYIKVPIYYNDVQIQDLRSSHCGLYCLDFLKDPLMLNRFKLVQYYN